MKQQGQLSEDKKTYTLTMDKELLSVISDLIHRHYMKSLQALGTEGDTERSRNFASLMIYGHELKGVSDNMEW